MTSMCNILSLYQQDVVRTSAAGTPLAVNKALDDQRVSGQDVDRWFKLATDLEIKPVSSVTNDSLSYSHYQRGRQRPIYGNMDIFG